MSSGIKCDNCGSSDIEVDQARGDTVCMNCGSVLGNNIIVSEVQFEEGAQGSSRAIGTFVSAESTGHSVRLGASLNFRPNQDSREVTLRRARKGIEMICNNLSLKTTHVDQATCFYKMALTRNITKGRRNMHIYAACVYLTCRTEETGHMLIDISDVLNICCFRIGRTYLRITQALHINIPSVDPCIYIMRFASKLQFGDKTQMVTNTALRLVQRMKRDSIHSGRKPNGLCGAALLIAARLHEFGRTTGDIVKIVKVHESTIRKRLVEFGDTPSSALKLDEFMTVDLEDEQDPPSFKAARKKDKERLQRVLTDESDSINDLQKQIEAELEKSRSRRKTKSLCQPNISENSDIDQIIKKSTLEVVNSLVSQCTEDENSNRPQVGLGPNLESMGLPKSLEDIVAPQTPPAESLVFDMTFDDIDDDEIDSYILTEDESQRKNDVWQERNAQFLQEQKEREERRKKEEEEGKPKKRKRPVKKNLPPASSAKEAIERVIQEKKLSSKINYDVLKLLTGESQAKKEPAEKRPRLSSVSSNCSQVSTSSQKTTQEAASPEKSGVTTVLSDTAKKGEEPIVEDEEYLDDEYYEDQPADDSEMDALQMYKRFRGVDNDENEYYDEEDY